MKLSVRTTRFPRGRFVLAATIAAAALIALMTGSGISGDNPAVVKPALTIVPGANNAKLVLSSGEVTELVVFNQDTNFAGAAETYPGDRYAIKTLLNNSSNADVVQRITIDAPDGFDFEVVGGSRVSVSQETANTFLIRVSTDASGQGGLTNNIDDGPETDELRIGVRAGGQVGPGFYRIGIDLSQFVVRETGL